MQERAEALALVGGAMELARLTRHLNEALQTAMTPQEVAALPEEFIEVVLAMRQPPKKEPRKRGTNNAENSTHDPVG